MSFQVESLEKLFTYQLHKWLQTQPKLSSFLRVMVLELAMSHLQRVSEVSIDLTKLWWVEWPTLSLETVFVSSVSDFDHLSFWRRVRVAALYRLDCVFGSFVLDVTCFLSFDAIGWLVTPFVASITVVDVFVRNDFDWWTRRLWRSWCRSPSRRWASDTWWCQRNISTEPTLTWKSATAPGTLWRYKPRPWSAGRLCICWRQIVVVELGAAGSANDEQEKLKGKRKHVTYEYESQHDTFSMTRDRKQKRKIFWSIINDVQTMSWQELISRFSRSPIVRVKNSSSRDLWFVCFWSRLRWNVSSFQMWKKLEISQVTKRYEISKILSG